MWKSERWNGRFLTLAFSLLDGCQVNNRLFSQVLSKMRRGNSCKLQEGRLWLCVRPKTNIIEKVVKYQNGPERLWNICLGDIQNSAESKFEVSFEQVAGQDDLQRSLQPFLYLSAQKNLNREPGKLHYRLKYLLKQKFFQIKLLVYKLFLTCTSLPGKFISPLFNFGCAAHWMLCIIQKTLGVSWIQWHLLHGK